MKIVEFEMLKRKFASSTTEDKIKIYVETEGLNKEQYRELLKIFPLNELGKLEAALQ